MILPSAPMDTALSIAGSDNKATRLIFNRARSKGLLMIAAAGNWGSATRAAYPAAYRDVVAVTAIGAGRTIYRHANRGAADYRQPGLVVGAGRQLCTGLAAGDRGADAGLGRARLRSGTSTSRWRRIHRPRYWPRSRCCRLRCARG